MKHINKNLSSRYVLYSPKEKKFVEHGFCTLSYSILDAYQAYNLSTAKKARTRFYNTRKHWTEKLDLYLVTDIKICNVNINIIEVNPLSIK